MDIQTRKIEFIQEFLKLQNEELISRLENLLRASKSKNDDFKQMTIGKFRGFNCGNGKMELNIIKTRKAVMVFPVFVFKSYKMSVLKLRNSGYILNS